MKILLVVAAVISTVTGFGYGGRRAHLNRNVSYSCTQDGSVGTMQVFIETTDHLDLIYLETLTSPFNNTVGVFDSNGTGITGDGSAAQPYTFEVTADYLNFPVSVITPAGIPSGSSDPGVLDISLILKHTYRSEFDAQVASVNDSRHILSCNFTEASSNAVTSRTFVAGDITEDSALLVYGGVVLEMFREALNDVTIIASLGEDIHLRLSLPPGSESSGVYGRNCYACSDPTCPNPILLIDNFGCSVDPDRFTGFHSEGDFYVTGTFDAFQIDHQFNFLVTCTVGFCPNRQDQRCHNLCAFNMAGRKKRQALEEPEQEEGQTSGWFRIVINFDDQSDSPTDRQVLPIDGSQSFEKVVNEQYSTGLLAAVITLAGVLLLCLIVAIVAFLHLFTRRRRGDHKA